MARLTAQLTSEPSATVNRQLSVDVSGKHGERDGRARDSAPTNALGSLEIQRDPAGIKSCISEITLTQEISGQPDLSSGKGRRGIRFVSASRILHQNPLTVVVNI